MKKRRKKVKEAFWNKNWVIVQENSIVFWKVPRKFDIFTELKCLLTLEMTVLPQEMKSHLPSAIFKSLFQEM